MTAPTYRKHLRSTLPQSELYRWLRMMALPRHALLDAFPLDGIPTSSALKVMWISSHISEALLQTLTMRLGHMCWHRSNGTWQRLLLKSWLYVNSKLVNLSYYNLIWSSISDIQTHLWSFFTSRGAVGARGNTYAWGYGTWAWEPAIVCLAAQAALIMVGKYYALTDDCEVYRLAIGEFKCVQF